MSEKQDRLQYIVRASHATGWVVRPPARVLKMLQAVGYESKAATFFSDSAHGGRDLAKQAAIAYRSEVFRRAGLNVEALGTVRSQGAVPSVSGLCGVVPGYRKNAAFGVRYVGRWFALQGSGKVEFSVAKLGMMRAFWAAVRTRQSVTGIPFALGELKAAIRVVRELPDRGRL